MSELDVASYLAQRKAKKASSGSSKFKTFSASAALVTGEGQNDETAGLENGDRSHSSYSAAAISNANAKTLVQGEWIEDDGLDANEPRLLTAGGKVVDLESLALEEKVKAEKAEKEEQKNKPAYPVRQLPPDLAAESASLRPSSSRRAQVDFPALGTAAAAPVPSVWANRVSAQQQQQQAQAGAPEPPAAPAVAAEPTKPGVWRPKSHLTAAAAVSSSSAASAAPRPAAAAAPAAAPVSRPTESADGLRRAAQPWRPSNRAMTGQ